VIGKTFS